MHQLRVTTFNVENLFDRYVILDGGRVQLAGAGSIDRAGKPLSETTTLLQRNNTARAILDSQPDIAALVEVESLWALRCFNDEYLGGYFGEMVLLSGNDGRGINVAFCLRHGLGPEVRISALRTHVEETDPRNEKVKRVNRFFDESGNQLQVTGALFSRDCLEVDVEAWEAPLTFLVNHLKAQDGNKTSDALRNVQATRVAQLVTEVKARKRLPIVLGDLNEDWDKVPSTNLKPLKELVASGGLTDPFQTLPERWTHFYVNGGETTRLDYILTSPELKAKESGILRSGLSLRCKDPAPRYPTIGYVGTEASDHCPVTVTVELE